MKKLRFRYSNALLFNTVWCSFALIGLLLIYPLILTKNWAIWLVDTFDLIGLIVAILLAIALFLMIFLGSFLSALKLTDKNGEAILFDEYVEIIMENKHIKINYAEIIRMKPKYFFPPKGGYYRPWGFRMTIKTRNMNIRITNSAKERLENRKQGYKYMSTLEKVYKEIYSILSKNELEYMLKHAEDMIKRGELK